MSELIKLLDNKYIAPFLDKYKDCLLPENIKNYMMLYEIYCTVEPVTIYFTNGTQIIACKPILILISDYFKSMFESVQDPHIELAFNRVVTKMVLESCYLESITPMLRVNNIVDFFDH